MPHRTTYFFPRQFPDRACGCDASSTKFLLGHEGKGDNSENEPSGKERGDATFNQLTKEDPNSDRFTGGDKIHGTQLVAFVSWLAGKKSSLNQNRHVKVKVDEGCEADNDEHRLLVPEVVGFDLPVPEQVTSIGNDKKLSLQRLSSSDSNYSSLGLQKENGGAGFRRQASGSHYSGVYGKEKALGFDRQVPLQRLSSGESTSYAGSFFSGTTLEGNYWPSTVISEVKDSDLSTTTGEVQAKQGVNGVDGLAQRSKESYYLQLTLAKTLVQQATLAADELMLLPECRSVKGHAGSSDPETVSYRLWVNGCLSYADMIVDGFYNILGVNPYLWVMCNDLEEGKSLPSLVALKETKPSDTSMEVILIDRHGDSRLRELEDKAQEMYFTAENTLVLVEQLGKLVAVHMGGSFPVEQGDLHMCWKIASERLKDFERCIVLPIGNLSAGLCRHRAILFKKLADYVGLPCRIARGCKYCVEDHRSSCLVKIEDDRKFSREYVVDLIGEPGNVHDPDSSINGSVRFSVPSPFQISHLKEFQQPYMDCDIKCQLENSNYTFAHPSGVCSGTVDGNHPVKDVQENNIPKNSLHGHNQSAGSESPKAFATAEIMGDGDTKLGDDKIVIRQTYKKEIILSKMPVYPGRPPKITFASNSDVTEIESSFENYEKHSTSTIPKYLNLEPSLAMDWLEISWDELHIKERVGAGSFGTVHRAEWHGSDVAVKVLTVQDFHDDQLREFLREVCACSET
nr:serine/threonine-protein kinase CTR1 [Ipomoea batatas]